MLLAQPDDPETPDVRALLDAHLAFARQHSPPEDVHALDEEGRLADDVEYFTIRDNGSLLGVGALKRLDESHVALNDA